MKRFLFLFAAVLLLNSCRQWIVEDRNACPSFLFFDTTNGGRFNAREPVWASVYSHPKGQLMDIAETSVEAMADGTFYFIVRGTEFVKGYGLVGYGPMKRVTDDWYCPLGTDYPPVFHFTYQDAVREESFTVPVELVKDYVHVRLQFVGFESFIETGGRFPFDVVLRGNTCGINGLSGAPLHGDYEYRPVEHMEGCYEFNVPRLADNFLLLELYGREAYPEFRGHDRTLDLNGILRAEAGINWSEKNLPDVQITVDYEEFTTYVSVSEWGQSVINYEY